MTNPCSHDIIFSQNKKELIHMMYRNYSTGEIIDEVEVADYIDDKFDLLTEDGSAFVEWLDDNFTVFQVFNFDENDKAEVQENFLDFMWNEAREAFLEDWKEIDDEEE